MVGWGMGPRLPVLYWASYSEMPARDWKTVGRERVVGGERSEMEKRMPLLEERRGKKSWKNCERGEQGVEIYEDWLTQRVKKRQTDDRPAHIHNSMEVICQRGRHPEQAGVSAKACTVDYWWRSTVVNIT
jgi:hypothetical protein